MVFAWWRENVIKPIHAAKIPLPRILGVPASSYMQFVYPVPVFVIGYMSYTFAVEQSLKNIGENGEKLRNRRDLNTRMNGLSKQNEALEAVLKRSEGKKVQVASS